MRTRGLLLAAVVAGTLGILALAGSVGGWQASVVVALVLLFFWAGIIGIG